MNRSAILLVILCVLTSACAFNKRNRPPDHQMIEMAYFICDQCQSAQGGIYGKGPTKHFRSSTAADCIHQWRRVSDAEFKKYAVKHFHYDWDSEIPFWSTGS